MAEIFKFPGKRDRGRRRPTLLTKEEFAALPDDVIAEVMAKVVNPFVEKMAASRPSQKSYRGSGVNIRTLCFRNRELILESSHEDLVRDARKDLDKAETKLKKIRQRLQSVQEWSAAQIEMLTEADTKLSAAIVAALLSTRGQHEAPAPISPEA